MENEQRLEMIKLIEADKMGVEQAFEAFVNDGSCPALIYDDFGNWAVACQGYQSIPANPGEPDNIDSSFFIEKKQWEKTIKAALINFLKLD